MHGLTGGIEPSVVSDPRILRAVAYIRAHLDAPLTLEEVAAEACLSPSRFRHLFVERFGEDPGPPFDADVVAFDFVELANR